MTPIQTGWQPEGALGAMYAGMNAANAEDENALNLAKLFMANKKEEQMAPLDIQAKQLSIDPLQYESALARAKQASASYIPSVLSGYEGQMKSQEAAGDKAMVLLPFAKQAEQATLENETAKQGFQWTINDLTNKINQGGDVDEHGNLVKASPQQMSFFRQKRDDLTKLVSETPEFAQKQSLQDDKQQAALEALQARMAAEQARAQIVAEARVQSAQEKAMSDKQLYAKALQTLTNPQASEEQRMVAQAILDRMQADAIGRNAALSAPTIDMNALTQGSIPMNTPASERARQQSQQSQEAAMGGGTGQSVVVKNAEEWKALKPGTKYRTPDGKTGVR